MEDNVATAARKLIMSEAPQSCAQLRRRRRRLAEKRAAQRRAELLDETHGAAMNDLFSNIPTDLPEELIEPLLETDAVRVERIVSHGHASPDGFWCDQEQSEWVVVVEGLAKIRFEDDDTLLELTPGDYVNIPAHKRHRVEWTTPEEPTIWLAVHYG